MRGPSTRSERAAGRRTAAALLLVLLAGLLVACSDDSGSGPDATPGPTAPPAPPRTPVAGDCHRLSWAEALAPSVSTDKTRCRKPTSITFHVGKLATKKSGETRRPDSRRVQRQMAQVCPQQLEEFLGGDTEARRLTVLTAVWFTPTPEQVEIGADWFRCDLVAPGAGETLVRLRPPMKGALDDEDRRTTYALCATGQPGSTTFARVPCARPHSWQAIATVDLEADTDAYPGPEALDEQLKQPCTDAAADAAADPLDLTWHQEVPTRAQWRGRHGQAGQRYGICWLPTP